MCIPFFKLKSVFPSLTKTRLIPCSYTVLMGRREPIQFTFGLGPLHSKLPIGPVRGDMARSTQHNAWSVCISVWVGTAPTAQRHEIWISQDFLSSWRMRSFLWMLLLNPPDDAHSLRSGSQYCRSVFSRRDAVRSRAARTRLLVDTIMSPSITRFVLVRRKVVHDHVLRVYGPAAPRGRQQVSFVPTTTIRRPGLLACRAPGTQRHE